MPYDITVTATGSQWAGVVQEVALVHAGYNVLVTPVVTESGALKLIAWR